MVCLAEPLSVVASADAGVIRFGVGPEGGQAPSVETMSAERLELAAVARQNRMSPEEFEENYEDYDRVCLVLAYRDQQANIKGRLGASVVLQVGAGEFKPPEKVRFRHMTRFSFTILYELTRALRTV